MSRMTDQEIASIVQAKINGADIEVKHIVDDDTEWFKPTDGAWNFINYVYRIVPPKPKLVKWYGFLTDARHVVMFKDLDCPTNWKRLPHLDCELPE